MAGLLSLMALFPNASKSTISDIVKPYLGEYECKSAQLGEKNCLERFAYIRLEFKDEENFKFVVGTVDRAKYCREVLLTDMEDLRKTADEMELLTGKEFIPFPTYEDILYSVKY